MRSHKMLFALCAVLLLQACSESDMQKVAKSMLVVAHAVGDAQTLAIQANSQNLIDDQTTGKILSICAQINVVGKQADALLRSATKLDPFSRSSEQDTHRSTFSFNADLSFWSENGNEKLRKPISE